MSGARNLLAWKSHLARHRGPSASMAAAPAYPSGVGGSQILIDATMNWPFPPVSLPTQQHMERAPDQLGTGAGPSQAAPGPPWFGYDLGYWPERWAKRPNSRRPAGAWKRAKSSGRSARRPPISSGLIRPLLRLNRRPSAARTESSVTATWEPSSGRATAGRRAIPLIIGKVNRSRSRDGYLKNC